MSERNVAEAELRLDNDGYLWVGDMLVGNVPNNGDQATRRILACWNAANGLSTDMLENVGGIVLEAKVNYQTLQQERDELVEALQTVRLIALEARAKWDDDKDMSVGKLLMALAGLIPGYRRDTDAIHALLARHTTKAGL